MYKNASHRRNDSGELDVFEAARYFSSIGENPSYITNHANISQKIIGPEDVQHVPQAAPRMSLDMPRSSNNQIMDPPPHYNAMDHQNRTKDNKKYNQPNSPGRRLTSFLNSLFNQTSLKKKKPKHGGPNKGFNEEEEESPGGRRKRRISISHFRITSSTNINDTKALYSGLGPGFRTPPPYAGTPTKSYKQVIALPKTSAKLIKPTSENEKTCAEKRSTWINEETNFRFSNSGVSEKIVLEKTGSFGFSSEERDLMRKFSDGEDSDSSSDLFDLPNIELDFYSSGLPVYETTDVDRIKIGTPVSSTRIV